MELTLEQLSALNGLFDDDSAQYDSCEDKLLTLEDSIAELRKAFPRFTEMLKEAQS